MTMKILNNVIALNARFDGYETEMLAEEMVKYGLVVRRRMKRNDMILALAKVV